MIIGFIRTWRKCSIMIFYYYHKQGVKTMKNPAIIFGSRMLKAMGNEKRLEILYHLFETELKVGDLEKLVGLSQSALSQHLAILRAENIVKTRRVAQTIFYSIRNNKVIRILRLMDSMFNRQTTSPAD